MLFLNTALREVVFPLSERNSVVSNADPALRRACIQSQVLKLYNKKVNASIFDPRSGCRPGATTHGTETTHLTNGSPVKTDQKTAFSAA
jgi:hypothetical protein